MWVEILGSGIYKLKRNDFVKAWGGFAKDKIHNELEKKGLAPFQIVSELGHSHNIFFFVELDLTSSCGESPSVQIDTKPLLAKL